MRMEISDNDIKKTRTFAVSLFAFSVLFSVTAVEAALFLLAGALVFERCQAGELPLLFRQSAGQPLFRLWMFYLAAGLFSAVFALNKGPAFAYLPSDLIKYLCFTVLLSSMRKEILDTMLDFYAAGAVLTAAVGTGHVAWFFSSFGTFYQRAGAFLNPVRFGEVMVIAFAFVLSTALLPPKSWLPVRRKYHLAAIVLIFVTILLTRTRGSFLGLAAIPAFMFAIDSQLRKRLAAWIAALILIGTLAAVLNPHLRGRIVNTYTGLRGTADSPSPGRLETVGNKDSVGINIRMELWKLGFAMFKDHPLSGIGPANIKSSFKTYHPGPLGIQEIWGSVHNLYLQHMAERGIIGLTALLALFGGMFALALKNFRAERNAYTLWALALLPAYFIMNVTEISFQHVHTSFAVFLALAASTNSVIKENAA